MTPVESVSIASSPVLDVVATPGGDLLAAAADGTIALLARDTHAPRVVRPAGDMQAVRVVHVGERVVALWGWETVAAIALDDGREAWRIGELDGHHGLDGDEGTCAVSAGAAALPDGTLIDVEEGALLEVEGRCFLGTPSAAAPDGIVYASGRALHRWRRGAPIEQLGTFHADVLAVAVDAASGVPAAVLASRRIATPAEGSARAIPLPLPEYFAASLAVDGALVVAGFAFETAPARWFQGVALLDGERVLFSEHARSEQPFVPVIAHTGAGLVVGTGDEVLLCTRAGVQRASVGDPVRAVAPWGARVAVGTASGAVVVLAL